MKEEALPSAVPLITTAAITLEEQHMSAGLMFGNHIAEHNINISKVAEKNPISLVNKRVLPT